jgi:hypothetical protein
VAAIRRFPKLQATAKQQQQHGKAQAGLTLVAARRIKIWPQKHRGPRSLRVARFEKDSWLSRFLLCAVNVAAVGLLVPRRRQRRLSQSS